MKVRVVPTKTHAAVDHVVGPTLMLAPELFRLKDDRKETWMARAMGSAQGVYSNLTDYELAAKRLLPVKVHLALDAMSGALLGASPWLLGSAKRGKRHWLPLAVVGAMEIGLAATTKTEPGDRRGLDHRLKLALKLAGRPQTWKAVGKAGRTVAASPPLRKATRQLAKAL